MRWRDRVLKGLVGMLAGLHALVLSDKLAAQKADAPPPPRFMQNRETEREHGANDGLRIAIDSLYVLDGAVRVDFHADSAVTVKLLEGLRRGLTASITYHVQVWQKRWLSDLVAERRLEWKASFDNWERKFIVAGLGEKRLTASANTVREKWTQHRGVRLTETNRLQTGKNYFVVIEAFLEPVSKENLREIRGWLAGEVKEVSSSSSPADSSIANNSKADSTGRTIVAPAESTDEKPGFKLRILETVVNLIGFGGKKVNARSRIFQIEENTILWQP